MSVSRLLILIATGLLLHPGAVLAQTPAPSAALDEIADSWNALHYNGSQQALVCEYAMGAASGRQTFKFTQPFMRANSGEYTFGYTVESQFKGLDQPDRIDKVDGKLTLLNGKPALTYIFKDNKGQVTQYGPCRTELRGNGIVIHTEGTVPGIETMHFYRLPDGTLAGLRYVRGAAKPQLLVDATPR